MSDTVRFRMRVTIALLTLVARRAIITIRLARIAMQAMSKNIGITILYILKRHKNITFLMELAPTNLVPISKELPLFVFVHFREWRLRVKESFCDLWTTS